MAYARGLLTQKNINVVQEQMLLAVMYRKKKIERENEQYKFEQDMMINNPSMYSEYLKQKQDDIASGNTGVTWIAPESVEEANEMLKVFSEIDEQMKSSTTQSEAAADAEFIKQVSSMNLFGDIDIDQLGD